MAGPQQKPGAAVVLNALFLGTGLNQIRKR